MNRYRRSAQKSGPEAPLNVDDSIYFICGNTEEKVKKPNIISRKTSQPQQELQQQEKAESGESSSWLNQEIPAVCRSFKESDDYDDDGQQQIQSESVELKNEPSLQTGSVVVQDGQCAYYHLEDGSLAVVDLSSLVTDVKACALSLNGITQESSQNSDCSHSTMCEEKPLLPDPAELGGCESSESKCARLDGMTNGESTEGCKHELEKCMEDGKEAALGSRNCSTPGLQLGVEASEKRQDESEALTASLQPAEGVPQSLVVDEGNDQAQADQFHLLKIGNQSIYVPVQMYQDFCNAQAKGDVAGIASFLSQVQQALGVPLDELISQFGSSSVMNQLPVVSSDAQSVANCSPTTNVSHLQEARQNPDGATAESNQQEPSLKVTEPASKTGMGLHNAKIPGSTANQYKCPTESSMIDRRIPKKGSKNVNFFKCGTCAMLFSEKQLCLEHIYAMHKGNKAESGKSTPKTSEEAQLKPSHVCHLCQKTCVSAEELESHVKTSHRQYGSSGSDPDAAASQYPNIRESEAGPSVGVMKPGDDASQKTAEENELPGSKKFNLPKDFVCGTCNRTLSSLYYFLIHGLLHVETHDEWICQICGARFSAKPEITEHFMIHCQEKEEVSGSLTSTDSSSTTLSSGETRDLSNSSQRNEFRNCGRRSRRKSPVRAASHPEEETRPSEASSAASFTACEDEQTVASEPDKTETAETGRRLGKRKKNDETAATVKVSEAAEEGLAAGLRRSNRGRGRPNTPNSKDNDAVEKRRSKSDAKKESTLQVKQEKKEINSVEVPKRTTRLTTVGFRTEVKEEEARTRSSRLSKKYSGGSSLEKPQPALDNTPRRSLRTGQHKVTRGTNSAENDPPPPPPPPASKEESISGKQKRKRNEGVKVKSEEQAEEQPLVKVEVDGMQSEDAAIPGSSSIIHRRSSKRKATEPAVKDEILETKPEVPPPPAQKQTKRGRKSSTTTRQILPEDGPQFETVVTAPMGRKSGRNKSDPVTTVSKDVRSVRQSFIDIFTKVKGDPGVSPPKK